jgi:hypothetical protein
MVKIPKWDVGDNTQVVVCSSNPKALRGERAVEKSPQNAMGCPFISMALQERMQRRKGMGDNSRLTNFPRAPTILIVVLS